jgi:Brp/Blh family beta-carotene 15,15'-monooxygenase
MHSILMITIVLSLLVLDSCGIGYSRLGLGSLIVIVAAMVSVVGVPHGGLDHRVGQKFFRSRSILSWAGFFVSYLAISMVVVAGWYTVPLFTVLAIFCLSSWHFGLEEDPGPKKNILQWAGLIARGGMVIWVPAAFQSAAMTELLDMVLPQADVALASQVVAIVRFCVPALALLTLSDMWFAWRDSASGSSGSSKQSAGKGQCVRIAAFALLFATAHPIVSFGLYFCGWHSIQGLIHLREQFGGTWPRFAGSLLPISFAALAMFGLGFYYLSTVEPLTPALVRTLFIGLSAIAVPHLMLHVASDLQSTGSQRSLPELYRGLNPGGSQ